MYSTPCKPVCLWEDRDGCAVKWSTAVNGSDVPRVGAEAFPGQVCQPIVFSVPPSIRVVVVGTSGSGKTTVAEEIAQMLDLPHVEFDAYRHGPNWTETPDPVFRENLRQALAGDSWVADGNYSVARDIVWPRATALVWLDYPIRIVLWRLFLRTLRRGVLRQELWNGNRENTWEHLFTRNSLFIWALKTHWRRRSTIPAALQQPDYTHLEVIRQRSPKHTRDWIRALGSSHQANLPDSPPSA